MAWDGEKWTEERYKRLEKDYLSERYSLRELVRKYKVADIKTLKKKLQVVYL